MTGQTGASPAVRGGSRVRRTRWLVIGTLAAAVATAAVVWHRKPPAYVPGTEAATSEEITRTLNRSVPEGVPKVTFTEVTTEAGIRFHHFDGTRSTQLPEDMGSGAAWGDYDGDGDPDLYLVNESGPLTRTEAETEASPARSALYRNEGNGAFTDVTEEAGLAARGCGMGAAWGDYDGDGRLDLVVTRFGRSVLFHNEGAGRFRDASVSSGLAAEKGFWTGASWADYDRDGDLDLYVCGYVQYTFDPAAMKRTAFQYKTVVPYSLNPSAYAPERNLLFENMGGGRFREVGRKAGVENTSGRSLSATWCDWDGDGWPDLYVANDISDNAMFHNRGDGTFADISHSAWVADYRGAMGLGLGDWDGDLDFDIFITHWIAQENAFYVNQKGTMAATAKEPMRFVDMADDVGLGQIALDFVGWGTDFFDYDNDGRLDLFVVNGSTFQRDDDPSKLVPMKNQLFWNAGPSKGFYEVGELSGKAFAAENVGRGWAWADYDGDGDPDGVVVVNGGPARLLRNDGGNTNGWLRVVLRGGSHSGKGPATTSFAQNAVVTISAGGQKQIAMVGNGSSYLSQSPPGEVHFGLGAAPTVEAIEILWPDGALQHLGPVPARCIVKIVEGRDLEVSAQPGPKATAR